MAGRSSVVSDAHLDRLPTPSESSRHGSPDPLVTVVTEMFVSDENLNKMENLLDTWSDKLKVSLPCLFIVCLFNVWRFCFSLARIDPYEAVFLGYVLLT